MSIANVNRTSVVTNQQNQPANRSERPKPERSERPTAQNDQNKVIILIIPVIIVTV